MSKWPDRKFTKDMEKMFVMVVQVIDNAEEYNPASRDMLTQPFHCESEELATAWASKAIEMFDAGLDIDLLGTGYTKLSDTEFLDLLALPLHVWLMPEHQETVTSLEDLL